VFLSRCPVLLASSLALPRRPRAREKKKGKGREKKKEERKENTPYTISASAPLRDHDGEPGKNRKRRGKKRGRATGPQTIFWTRYGEVEIRRRQLYIPRYRKRAQSAPDQYQPCLAQTTVLGVMHVEGKGGERKEQNFAGIFASLC